MDQQRGHHEHAGSDREVLLLRQEGRWGLHLLLPLPPWGVGVLCGRGFHPLLLLHSNWQTREDTQYTREGCYWSDPPSPSEPPGDIQRGRPPENLETLNTFDLRAYVD